METDAKILTSVAPETKSKRVRGRVRGVSGCYLHFACSTLSEEHRKCSQSVWNIPNISGCAEIWFMVLKMRLCLCTSVFLSVGFFFIPLTSPHLSVCCRLHSWLHPPLSRRLCSSGSASDSGSVASNGQTAAFRYQMNRKQRKRESSCRLFLLVSLLTSNWM